VGAGAVSVGDAYCCLGTTAWIAATRAEAFIDEKRRAFNIINLDGETYGAFGTVQSAGRSLAWALDLLGEDIGGLEAHLSAVPLGSDGLLFLPYLEGERSPLYDPKARGVFFGLTPAHGRSHLLRATVEGVSFALRTILDIMRDTTSIDALRLIGGGGQSAMWRQMLAGICGLDVHVLSTESADATSLGAALTAGVGIGLFADFAEATKSIRVVEEVKPRKSSAEAYARLHAIHESLYGKLKSSFAELWDITRG
jgi:xylulokinase